jgi:hypothetical protein
MATDEIRDAIVGAVAASKLYDNRIDILAKAMLDHSYYWQDWDSFTDYLRVVVCVTDEEKEVYGLFVKYKNKQIRSVPHSERGQLKEVRKNGRRHYIVERITRQLKDIKIDVSKRMKAMEEDRTRNEILAEPDQSIAARVVQARSIPSSNEEVDRLMNNVRAMNISATPVAVREDPIDAYCSPDMTHVASQLISMYEKSGAREICKVCYEEMVASVIFVPKCGHLICRLCRHNWPTNCPECRREYV